MLMNTPRRTAKPVVLRYRIHALVLASVLALAVATLGSTSVSAAKSGPSKAARAHHKCHGHRATIVKNSHKHHGDSVVFGTKHRDIIWTGRGDDIVVGKGGKDLICVGKGDDIVDGGKKKDTVYGGSGGDTCYATSNREHLRHHQCEFHETGTVNGNHHQVPPPPNAKNAVTPKLAKNSPVTAQRGGGFQSDADLPVCDWGSVDLGNFYFTAEYTDPGYVAYRPIYAEKLATGEFGNDNVFDWIIVNAPNDGQLYQVTTGVVNLSFETIWGYEVWWWDGSQWATSDSFYVPRYYWGSTGGTLPACES